MLKNMYKLFNENILTDEAYQEYLQMLTLGEEIFIEGQKTLRESGFSSSIDFSNKVKDIHSYERSIRRKIFTHLSVSQEYDLNASLILVAIVQDMGQIGNYAESIYQVSRKVEGRLDFKEYESKVLKIEDSMKDVFNSYKTNFSEMDSSSVRGLMEDLTKAIESNDHLIDEITDKGDANSFDKKEMALVIVYLGLLKRIATHLRNMATSFLNPFDRIGFVE